MLIAISLAISASKSSQRPRNHAVLIAQNRSAPTVSVDVTNADSAGNDHRLVWAKLDQVHEKHPDMVLIHGKSPKDAEKIASLWARNRNVPQIGFAPDWAKHGRAAPFKRNDEVLDIMPRGVIHFPGTGINDNLADKAKKLGIPVWRSGGA
ncbi:uncharacterized protein DUF2493 [Aminobacter sp. AP02]|nr:uncharacterized protein DUF2493 [Aminobacter sp. AP02]